MEKLWHPLFTSEQEVTNYFAKKPHAKQAFEDLGPFWQPRMMQFMLGKKTLPLTYDPFFKKVFHADTNSDRLESLLSSILERHVTIENILPTEDVLFDGETLVIMDIVVRLDDGSLANVEIQKYPSGFPDGRMSCYSSDLLMREYNKIKAKKGKSFSYQDIHKVYTIVIYENSKAAYHDPDLNGQYIHHGAVTFDSGLKLNLLQEFHVIALDVFTEPAYTRDRNTLNGWLTLLSTEDISSVPQAIADYPWLTAIFKEMANYMIHPEEVLTMFSEALRIMDRNSTHLYIDELQKEKDQLRDEVRQLHAERDNLQCELTLHEAELLQYKTELTQHKSMIEQQESKIKQQESKIEQQESKIEQQESKIEQQELKLTQQQDIIDSLRVELDAIKAMIEK